MKNPVLALTALAVGLSACSTTPGQEKGDPAKSKPETVLVTYDVKPGMEKELQDVLGRAWAIYRKEHLVFSEPHIIVQDKTSGVQTRFIEIFTWVSHSAPEHAPESVKAIWRLEQSLCESRDGRSGLGGGEVELLVPASK